LDSEFIKNINNIKGCIIIATYNNEKTLSSVIDGVLNQLKGNSKLIVVNDGSTDSTLKILNSYKKEILILSYNKNKGKGYALRQGLKKAIELGYNNAITLDSDGQHFPNDMPKLVQAAIDNPEAVIMGSRNMEQKGVPGKSSFGNKFSNFWFKVETFISLPDTQTGYRLYPLAPISKMKFYTTKFEFEIEVIVRLAWRGIKFNSVPVKVVYEEENRISHFRPFIDFTRISILNTILVTICIFYYYPKRLFSINTLKVIKNEAVKSEESNFNKSLSIAFGCFMGVIPIWGFQLLIGIPLAILMKLNLVLFIGAANISIPPFIPIILYISLIIGQFVLGGEIDHGQLWDTSFESIKGNIYTYVIGAIWFAFILFISSFSISFLLLKIFRPEK